MHAVVEGTEVVERVSDRDARRITLIVVEMIRAKRIEDAIALARAGVNLAPNSGDSWNTLAYAYSYAKGLEREQAAAARESVRLKPEDPSAWHNLSLGAMKCFDFDGALEASGRAMALPSTNPYYPLQAGFLASMLGQNERALSLLETARRRAKTDVAIPLADRLRFFAEIDIQAAQNFAAMGDWSNFCSSLDTRHELSTETLDGGAPCFLKRMWQLGRLWKQGGQTGDTDEVLCYLEWGIGDQIQFARLIPKVLKGILGARHVTVACSAPLLRLIADVEGVDKVIDHRDPALTPENIRPDVAVIPVIDLMAELHRFGQFPLGSFSGPYIRTPGRSNVSGGAWRWKPRRQAGKIAIAFAWQGDPKQPQDFNRRIPFPQWGRFAKAFADRFSFHSVQTKFGGHIEPWEGWPAGVPVEDCGRMIRDMRDAAEVISKCDVFVGQCGANVHLAGAMGKPAVVMLSRPHDFRWDFEPLYDIGIVQQVRPGDWPSAFDQLSAAIDRVVDRRSAEFSKEE